MELNDEQFWKALRHALELAEADEAQEMAAAERQLAETAIDAGSRMSEQRIDEVVQFAITPTAAELAAAASEPREEEEEGESEGAPGRVIPIAFPTAASAARPSWRKRVMAALPKPLAAAAAILLAPQFLAVAAVATAVVVSSVVLRNTKDTLSFEDAVILMMQEDAPVQARVSSQGRLVADIKDSIEVVQEASREASAVATAAIAVLDELRRTLTQGGPFVSRVFRESLLQLGNQVADASVDASTRTAALRSLGDQLSYGVLALKSIEQSQAPDELKKHNRLWLIQLSDKLSQ